MLNNIVSTYKMKRISCKFPKYPYFCIVFFIVLDLRLTKVGARRCSFFILSPYFYDKTSISFNPETSTYLQSFSTESLRQDNQVEIYEGNADVIYGLTR